MISRIVIGRKAMAISTQPDILIRELESVADLHLALALERETWECTEADSMPLTIAVATRAAGAMWLGAFENAELAGFAFALPALKNGSMGFHSHMLAVRASSQGHGIGRALKIAQRERALSVGVKKMTWTFDPLRAANAHFNFSKLGVVCDDYRIDFYGPRTSSPLHANGTDRLWVTWPMAERSVEDRLRGGDSRVEVFDALIHLDPLVRFNGDARPSESAPAPALTRHRTAIEIPGDIGRIEREDPALGREWRLATRRAFTQAINAGFVVTEFCRSVRGQQGPGAYLLEHTGQRSSDC